MSAPALPEVSLGNVKVSRLMVGGNPFSGNSHRTTELSEEMLDYYTTERIKADLWECERCGITAAQLRGDGHIRRLLREYWNEGGKIKWLAQSAPEMADFATHVKQVKSWGASAMYIHGGVADGLFSEGRASELHEQLKLLRDQGIPIGLGAHRPQLVEEAESQGWDLDFYVCCFHNLSRTPHESFLATGRVSDERFVPDDPARMCHTIRHVAKPVVAFKVFGAGRRCDTPDGAREALEFAYGNIKPTDAVTVGVFTKHSNQIAENAEIVRDLLSAQVAKADSSLRSE